MTCFCSAKTAPLLASLAQVPPTAGLVPPMPPSLMAAVAASQGVSPALSATVPTGVPPAALANLSAMASLSAATQASMAMPLAAALRGPALPAARAQMLSSINSFNANSGALMPQLGQLTSLSQQLSGLAGLSGLMLGVQSALGIDLRAPGAVPALQARLQLPPPPGAMLSAPALPPMQQSSTAALLAALGLKADASGAQAASAMASSTAQLTAGLPAIGNVGLLAVLAGLLPMLAAIKLALGVDLRAPNSAGPLSAALSTLPLNALAQLGGSMSVAAPPLPSLAASQAASASASANASAALNLSAVAAADLSAVGPLAMLMQATAQGGLGMPPGECGQPCPLAMIGAPPPVAAAAFGH